MPKIIDDHLTEEQAARELGVHVGTLGRWRRQRKGPAFIPIGRRIFYRREALGEWFLSREVRPARR